ncbi:uncharacterized protein EI97DRAFT_393107, partial [Westerdykella ornata]
MPAAESENSETRRTPTITAGSKPGIPRRPLPNTQAPHWFASPARSHAGTIQGRELPLHLIALILSYLDNVGDLARVTRTSRLLYYMTLPLLYENVTLRSYSDIRYIDGRPEGYGGGSPFAVGLNTLVSRPFTDYVKSFRVVGEWREHDVDDYTKGRVPDNSMMLQIAMRAALDRMKNLESFAWELSTKPMQTVYQSIMAKPSITCLTLRFQTRRIPRPTTVIPPLPNLRTLVVYDIDPLCYPDDISLLLLHAKKLDNLKLHWNPRMRDSGEESANLLNYFGRCMAAKHKVPLKRIALYNLYARNSGDGFENCTDLEKLEEVTLMNCMGSSDPTTVFLDNTWKVNNAAPFPPNLKMLRVDLVEKDMITMMSRQYGMERLYIVNRSKTSKPSSTAVTPAPPTSAGTPAQNGAGCSATGTPISETQCKSLASDVLAVIQSNHRTMRHLLLADNWVLSDNALFRLCQSCPDLEQFGFASNVPPLETLGHIFSLIPKLWAVRMLIRAGTPFADQMDSMDAEMHELALSTELWKPEFNNLKYIGIGDLIFQVGEVVYPPKPKGGAPLPPPGQQKSMSERLRGPIRKLTRLEREDVKHVEIWGLDTTEFDPKFP